jgi:hypothetical protein
VRAAHHLLSAWQRIVTGMPLRFLIAKAFFSGVESQKAASEQYAKKNSNPKKCFTHLNASEE